MDKLIPNIEYDPAWAEEMDTIWEWQYAESIRAAHAAEPTPDVLADVIQEKRWDGISPLAYLSPKIKGTYESWLYNIYVKAGVELPDFLEDRYEDHFMDLEWDRKIKEYFQRREAEVG